jgi:hypothetical protein
VPGAREGVGGDAFDFAGRALRLCEGEGLHPPGTSARRDHGDVHHSMFREDAGAQAMFGGEGLQIGGVERRCFVEAEKVHHGRVAGIVTQAESVADFVDGVEKHFLLRKFQAGVEGDPALEAGAVWKLGSSAHAGAPVEDGGRAVDQLERAVGGVDFVPVEVENLRPELQGSLELMGECGIGGGDSHTEVDAAGAEQIGVVVTGCVLTAPIGRGGVGRYWLSDAEIGHREEKSE